VSDDARQALVRVTPDAPVTASGLVGCLSATRTVSGTLASFVDPDPRPLADYSAEVWWGDGFSDYAQVVETSPGHFDVVSNHTYAFSGTKTAVVALKVAASASRIGGTYTAVSTFEQKSFAGGDVSFTSSGGTGTVQVTDNGHCGWTVVASEEWVTFPTGASGSGTTMLQYNVAPNTTLETRYATVKLAGQTLWITQTPPVGGTGLYLITPCRLYDSRETSSQINGGATWMLSTIATCGIAADAKALVANLTVVSPVLDGWLSVWKPGQTWPGVSTLNYRPGKTRANNAVIPLVDQAFMLRNGGQAPVHFIVDVTGYFK
jgi:hypothetical protein